MKVVYISILALAISMLSGCATSPPPSPKPEFSVSIKSEKKSAIATVEIDPIWESGDLFTATGISGFVLNVKNDTNKILRIVWAKSSISHGGNTHLIFVSGQKFIDANNPMVATVLPANGQMQKNIYSSAQPIFATGNLSGWRMRSIISTNFEVVLCIESNNVEEYFTIEISKK